jgi:3-methyladenine DNA glycosylase AlkD
VRGPEQAVAAGLALDELRRQLRSAADPARVPKVRRALQVVSGGYGDRDTVLGVSVPTARGLARRFTDLSLSHVERLLRSPVHEERLVALLILVRRFETGDEELRERIFRVYLANKSYVNNWDLVDTSAPAIVGAHLLARGRNPVHRLAQSRSVWERRIAVVSTLAFIRAGDYEETFLLARRLFADEERLIQKAVGWMLREVGKRDQARLIAFLERHTHEMPSIMHRHAVERLDSRVVAQLHQGGRRGGVERREPSGSHP